MSVAATRSTPARCRLGAPEADRELAGVPKTGVSFG